MHRQSRIISLQAWKREGIERFGKDPNKWLFKCPSCGQVQSKENLVAAGHKPGDAEAELGFSCIGTVHIRFGEATGVVDVMERSQGKGCNYQGALANNFSPVIIDVSKHLQRRTFEWADPEDIVEPCWKCNGDGVYCICCNERDVNCWCKDDQEMTDCPECNDNETEEP